MGIYDYHQMSQYPDESSFVAIECQDCGRVVKKLDRNKDAKTIKDLKVNPYKYILYCDSCCKAQEEAEVE